MPSSSPTIDRQETNNPPGSRLLIERWVYTSMSSHRGTGYHIVVRGKLNLRSREEQAEFSRLLIKLSDVSGLHTPVLAHLTIGSTGLLIQSLPLKADWMGRPGVYCTALAYNLEEMRRLDAASIWAVPDDHKTFLSHDQAVELDREHGAKYSDAVVLRADEVAISQRILCNDDKSWGHVHVDQILAALETTWAGQSIWIPSDNPAAFCRWLTVLTPPRQRPERTFLLHPQGEAVPPVDWLLSSSDGTVARALTRDYVRIDETAQPKSPNGRRLRAMVVDFLGRSEDIEAAIQAAQHHLAPDVDARDFWPSLLYSGEATELLGRDPWSVPTDQLVKAMSFCRSRLWTGEKLKEYWFNHFPKWQDHLHSLAAALKEIGQQAPDLTPDIHAGIWQAVVQAIGGPEDLRVSLKSLRQIPGLETLEDQLLRENARSMAPDDLGAILQECSSGARARYAETLIDLVPEVAMKSAIFGRMFPELSAHLASRSIQNLYRQGIISRDPEIRAWLAHEPTMLKLFTRADLRSGPPLVQGPAVVRLIAIQAVPASEALKWWQAWPPTDTVGRGAWWDHVCKYCADLNDLEIQQVVKAHFNFNTSAADWMSGQTNLLVAWGGRPVAPDLTTFVATVFQTAAVVRKNPWRYLDNLIARLPDSTGFRQELIHYYKQFNPALVNGRAERRKRLWRGVAVSLPYVGVILALTVGVWWMMSISWSALPRIIQTATSWMIDATNPAPAPQPPPQRPTTPLPQPPAPDPEEHENAKARIAQAVQKDSVEKAQSELCSYTNTYTPDDFYFDQSKRLGKRRELRNRLDEVEKNWLEDSRAFEREDLERYAPKALEFAHDADKSANIEDKIRLYRSAIKELNSIPKSSDPKQKGGELNPAQPEDAKGKQSAAKSKETPQKAPVENPDQSDDQSSSSPNQSHRTAGMGNMEPGTNQPTTTAITAPIPPTNSLTEPIP